MDIYLGKSINLIYFSLTSVAITHGLTNIILISIMIMSFTWWDVN